ncbi:MAG: NAD(P)H-dependent oxidoreductase [Thiotrichales bacterium]
MKILAIIAHPNPRSFCHALYDKVVTGLIRAGHEVRVRDLYRDRFDPVLGAQELADLRQGKVADDVAVEQNWLTWAEGLVFVYPLWWFDRPAMLKGWFDRVLTHGFAFTYATGAAQGLLTHRKALVVVTTGGSEAEFANMGVRKEHLVLPITQGTLRYCGVQEVVARLFWDVPGRSESGREAMLRAAYRLGESF